MSRSKRSSSDQMDELDNKIKDEKLREVKIKTKLKKTMFFVQNEGIQV